MTDKKAIIILTRGYGSINEYDMLVKRNEHIRNNLSDTNIELVFFHEGNITLEHQKYISSKTPSLKFIFVDIKKDELAFKKEKETIVFEVEPERFPISYRHMCCFWFVNFWNFVKDYDYILRIDEDCNIDFKIDPVFDDLLTHTFITGCLYPEFDFVSVGINDITLDFVKKECNIEDAQKKIPCAGPYTNVFAINLKKARENKKLEKYVQLVDESNKIYTHRWGDLPLWGEVVDYITGKNSIKIDCNMRYYHATHDKYVNY